MVAAIDLGHGIEATKADNLCIPPPSSSVIKIGVTVPVADCFKLAISLLRLGDGELPISTIPPTPSRTAWLISDSAPIFAETASIWAANLSLLHLPMSTLDAQGGKVSCPNDGAVVELDDPSGNELIGFGLGWDAVAEGWAPLQLAATIANVNINAMPAARVQECLTFKLSSPVYQSVQV